MEEIVLPQPDGSTTIITLGGSRRMPEQSEIEPDLTPFEEDEQVEQPAADELTQEEIERRAREMVENMTPEEREGLVDMHKHMASMYLPMVCGLLTEYARAHGAKMATFEGLLAAMRSTDEHGCLEVAVNAQAPKYMIRLDCVPPSYSVMHELAKLRGFSDAYMAEIKKHMGGLVMQGRVGFKAFVLSDNCKELWAAAGVAEPPCPDLELDAPSYTLFVKGHPETRAALVVAAPDLKTPSC
jgi:hypothetical protein